MQIDHDVQLIIVGALIGLVSSVLTSLFQAWLSRREYRAKKRDELSRALRHIQVATLEDIGQYGRKEFSRLTDGQSKSRQEDNRRRSTLLTRVIISAVVVVGLWLVFALTPDSVIRSISVGIAAFVVLRLFISSVFPTH